VLLWYVGPAAIAVWVVLHDARLDYRMLAVGVLLPHLFDLPWMEVAYAHTLLAAAVALFAVVAVTAGRRPARNRLLMVPVGMFLHLVLDGMWARPDAFWWPAPGTDVPDGSLFPSVAGIAVREVVGLLAVLWFGARFGLGDAGRRRAFLRDGQVQESAA
jgi:hypothetical protein